MILWKLLDKMLCPHVSFIWTTVSLASPSASKYASKSNIRGASDPKSLSFVRISFAKCVFPEPGRPRKIITILGGLIYRPGGSRRSPILVMVPSASTFSASVLLVLAAIQIQNCVLLSLHSPHAASRILWKRPVARPPRVC